MAASLYSRSPNIEAKTLKLEHDGRQELVDRAIYDVLVKAFKGGRVRRSDLTDEQWADAERKGLVTDEGETASLTVFARDALGLRSQQNRL